MEYLGGVFFMKFKKTLYAEEIEIGNLFSSY